jgi:hypothetical protein
MKARPVGSKSFFYLSILGSLYLLAEAVLRLFEKSLCVSEGCRIVDRLTRFDDLLIILIGFLTLGCLALLSGLNLRRQNGLLDSTINLALIAALAAEGFFVGYQIFWLPMWCLFCLSVFGIFLALGLLRLWGGKKEIAAGFAAFILVLGLIGLTLPPPGRALPSEPHRILFYSKECKYCWEIKAEIDQTRLEVTSVLVEEYRSALKSLGIQSVPSLLVNGPNEKLLLTGKEAIRRYLAACQSPGKTVFIESKRPILNKRSSKGSGESGVKGNLSPLGAPNPVFNPSADEGLCKENQKCD